MTEYKVICLTVQGRGRRMFRAGDIIKETDLYPSAIFALLRAKKIEEHRGVDPHNPIPYTGDIRLAICTGVWKRPDIFEYFSRGVDHVRKNMVKLKGYDYIEIKNDPLAAKMNATITRARDIKATHVICVGSDDILTPELISKYVEYIREGYDYIGVLDWYFYDNVTKKALYWGGYRDERRKGHTCGAGRVLSASLLEKWNWMPWENKDSKVLDNSMQTKLKQTKHSIKTFSLKEFDLYALDIKSSTNMTPFDLWDNAMMIDTKIIKQEFNFLKL